MTSRERDLRAKAHAVEQPGDVMLGNEKFVSFADAKAAAKAAIDAGVLRNVPFQYNNVLDIAPRDWDRMVSAMESYAPEPGTSGWAAAADGGKLAKLTTQNKVDPRKLFAVPAYAKAMGMLRSIGVSHLVRWVDSWHDLGALDRDVYADGYVTMGANDGRYSVAVQNPESLGDVDATWVMTHEIGHVADLAAHGGIYSAHASFALSRDAQGAIVPVGAVAKELHALYESDPLFKTVLGYPFDSAYTELDAVEAQGEMFAQMFAMYASPKGRARLAQAAPRTTHFIEEAINDIQQARPGSVHSFYEVVKRRADFGKSYSDLGNTGPGTVQGRQRGGEPAGNASRQNLAAQAVENLPERRITDGLPPKAKDAWTNVRDAFKRFSPYVLTTFQLAEQFGAKIKSLNVVTKINDLMRVESTTQQMVFDAVAKKWSTITQAERTKLDTVMLRATLQEMHPDLPFAHKDNAHLQREDAAELSKMQAQHAALAAKYRAMTPATQALYQEAKAALEKSRDRMVQETKNLQDAYGVTKSVPDKMAGPYFPLMRFGEYLAIGESKEYQALADELATATDDARKVLAKRLDAMKRDPKHFVVSAHESRSDMEAAQKTYAAQGLDARVSMANQRLGGLPREMHKMVQEMAHKMAEQFDGNTATAVVNAYTEMLMKSLPELNALNRQAQRKGVEGASPDMMRAFAATGRQSAFYTSRLMYGRQSAEAMLEMKKEVKGDIDLQHVHREMEKRAALSLVFNDSPVQDALSQAGHVWYLAASPTYVLMNSMQPWLVTGPVLAGKYGLVAATKALARASREALLVLKDARFKDGKWSPWEGINEASIPGASVSEDRKALRELMQRGIVDEGLQHEMEMFASGSDGKMAKLVRGMGWVSQQVELTNRVATALASFRLARAGGLSYDAAVQEAYATTVNTQMDYSQENTARFMREGGGVPAAKLIFQFRRYQQAMLYLLGSNIKKLTNPAERKAAGSTLAYFAVTSGLSAGVLGLPFMGVALAVANMFKGDDDEDGDAETVLRNALFDLTGDKDLATVLAKGLPAMFGADLSKRIGLGDVAAPFPTLDLSGATGQEKIGRVAAAVAGPVLGGLGASAFDAASYFTGGDYVKGTEKLLPKVAADVLRAGRYATEGLTDRKGEQILGPDEISAWELVMRAAGTTSTHQSNYYEGTRTLKNVEHAVQDAKIRIEHQFTAALRDGDMSDVRAKIDAFNEKHPALAIKPKDEVSWRKNARLSASQRDETGIKVNPKRDGKYADTLRFAR